MANRKLGCLTLFLFLALCASVIINVFLAIALLGRVSTGVAREEPLAKFREARVPILDQGREGACTGFGLATVVNYLLRTPAISDNTLVSARMLYEMAKRYDEEVRVERDAGMPSVFTWRGRRYEVADVIGRWRIEGRWWADGRDREYWRVEARGGAVWDLYHDRQRDAWHMERLWD